MQYIVTGALRLYKLCFSPLLPSACRFYPTCSEYMREAVEKYGVRRGVLIAESIWPNDAFPDGRGINTLTGADPIAPYGGAAFHDNKVWIKRCAAAI